MEFVSKCHGMLEYDERNVVTFESGIPGFEELKRFALVPHRDNDVFSVLQSLEDSDIGFVVISPFIIDKEYEVNLEESLVKKLKLASSENAQIISMVTLHSDVRKITVNLKAPIVINVENNLAHQVILNTDKYSIKTPLIKG